MPAGLLACLHASLPARYCLTLPCQANVHCLCDSLGNLPQARDALLLQQQLCCLCRHQVQQGTLAGRMGPTVQALFLLAKDTRVSDALKACEVRNPRAVRVAGLRRGFFVPGAPASFLRRQSWRPRYQHPTCSSAPRAG